MKLAKEGGGIIQNTRERLGRAVSALESALSEYKSATGGKAVRDTDLERTEDISAAEEAVNQQSADFETIIDNFTARVSQSGGAIQKLVELRTKIELAVLRVNNYSRHSADLVKSAETLTESIETALENRVPPGEQKPCDEAERAADRNRLLSAFSAQGTLAAPAPEFSAGPSGPDAVAAPAFSAGPAPDSASVSTTNPSEPATPVVAPTPEPTPAELVTNPARPSQVLPGTAQTSPIQKLKRFFTRRKGGLRKRTLKKRRGGK